MEAVLQPIELGVIIILENLIISAIREAYTLQKFLWACSIVTVGIFPVRIKLTAFVLSLHWRHVSSAKYGHTALRSTSIMVLTGATIHTKTAVFFESMFFETKHRCVIIKILLHKVGSAMEYKKFSKNFGASIEHLGKIYYL